MISTLTSASTSTSSVSTLTSTSAFTDGSVTETQSHIEYGRRVGYLDPRSAQEIDSSLISIHTDLNRVIATLRKSTK